MDRDDLILAEFEDRWTSGATSFSAFLQSCPDASSATQLELVKIDIELRWRNQQPKEAVSSEYQSVVAKLNSDQLAELVAWEFAVRNDWGDCVSRSTLQERHPGIADRLDKHFDLVSPDVAWPVVKAWNRGKVTQQVVLDRMVDGGRSMSVTSPPIETFPRHHRINLTDIQNVTLSRTQFQIVRTAIQEVRISNSSRNRAIAIESHGVLSPGTSLVVQIPAVMILSEHLSIAITPRGK